MAVRLGFSVSVDSQSIAYNTSTITIRVKAYWTYGSFNRSARSGTLTVEGNTYNFSSPFNVSATDSGNQVIYTKQITVNHKSDGTKGVQMWATYDTGVNAGVVSANLTRQLPTLPARAYISSAPNFTDEDNPTISYSNPAGTSASSVEACISLDGSKADVAYRAISRTGSSYTFNLTDAERDVLRKATTGKSRKVRFYLQTTIGGVVYRTYTEKTLTIINGAPMLSPVVEDTNATTVALTGDKNKLVKYYSNAKIAMGVEAIKQATLKTKKVVSGAKSLAADGTINAVESGKFVFTATDSRGFSASKTVNKTLINYIKLSCNLAKNMPDVNGNLNIKVSGNYFNGSFGAVSNTLTVQYRYKLSGGSYSAWTNLTVTKSSNTYTATGALSGLDYKATYIFQARAIDKLTTATTKETEVRATPVFDWGENDFNFNVKVTAQENLVFKNGGVGIRGTSTDGAELQALQPCNSNNNCVLGYGGYDNNVGATLVYGNEVKLVSNSSVFVNGMELGENKVLWEGVLYPTDTQTATFSEAVSKQATGIVLVFSRYTPGTSGGALDEHFSYHFIPKQIVALQSGKGSIFNLGTHNGTYTASKYIYISDTKLVGHANNSATQTTGNNGVKYDNNRFVLRYVIGV